MGIGGGNSAMTSKAVLNRNVMIPPDGGLRDDARTRQRPVFEHRLPNGWRGGVGAAPAVRTFGLGTVRSYKFKSTKPCIYIPGISAYPLIP